MLASMVFQPEESEIGRLLEALQGAARRGADVRLMIDAYSFIVKRNITPGPLLFQKTLPRRLFGIYRQRFAPLDELRRSGGHYTIVNPPKRALAMPFAGRSHIKFAVINNSVFIGGCNLSSPHELDMMSEWQDEQTADWLCDFEEQVATNGSVKATLNNKDLSKALSKSESLLIDSGVPDQSIIYDKALALIDQAERHIYLTCQFFPNDKTSQHLAAAVRRGVDVKVVYNHPSQHSFPLNLLHHGVKQHEKIKHPKELFDHQLPKQYPYIHAKLLATDKGTLLGSHNYVRAGVKLGTAEIALFTTNAKFGSDAIEVIESFKADY